MSVASEITRIKNNISSAYTALDGKGATLPQTQDSANLANTIESIPTGDSVVTEQALNLYDWEGTLLQSYTEAEAQALAALPNPSDCPMYEAVDHELLSFQEWNWSLADIKAWLTNHTQGKLNVGAIYTTTDEQDHNYWANPRGDGAKLINKQKRGTASIEWTSFANCYSLTSINIPNGVTSIGGYAFESCYSLTSISIPNGVTSIGDAAFVSCYSLTSINIPNGVTSIGVSAFASCYSLTSINIPNRVTSIGASAFEYCYNLFDILLEGKPSLNNTNALGSVPSTQKIYVPRANLSWFETATNWATYYSRFVAIEDNIEYLESLGYNVDAYKTGGAE